MTFPFRVRITKTLFIPLAVTEEPVSGLEGKALEINFRKFNFKEIVNYINVNIMHTV